MTGVTGQARSHRPFPPDALGAYVCGGFRSVSPSGKEICPAWYMHGVGVGWPAR